MRSYIFLDAFLAAWEPRRALLNLIADGSGDDGPRMSAWFRMLCLNTIAHKLEDVEFLSRSAKGSASAVPPNSALKQRGVQGRYPQGAHPTALSWPTAVSASRRRS